MENQGVERQIQTYWTYWIQRVGKNNQNWEIEVWGGNKVWIWIQRVGNDQIGEIEVWGGNIVWIWIKRVRNELNWEIEVWGDNKV